VKVNFPMQGDKLKRRRGLPEKDYKKIPMMIDSASN